MDNVRFDESQEEAQQKQVKILTRNKDLFWISKTV